jgi:hypothetical protein
VASNKGIAPFYIMYVSGHPDTTAQAQRLANVLKDAGVSARLYGGRETTHNKINADIGLADDAGTRGLDEFLATVLKQ